MEFLLGLKHNKSEKHITIILTLPPPPHTHTLLKQNKTNKIHKTLFDQTREKKKKQESKAIRTTLAKSININPGTPSGN